MTEPKHIGKYEILQEIGRGGFGTVYEARDPTLDDQIVAVKELRVPHIRQPNVVQRFLKEARKAINLKHRGLVHIYAVDEDERGIPYIAMSTCPAATSPTGCAANRCRWTGPSPSWNRSPPRSTTPTSGIWCTSTSSPPISSSMKRGMRYWWTLGWSSHWTKVE